MSSYPCIRHCIQIISVASKDETGKAISGKITADLTPGIVELRFCLAFK